MRVRTGRQPARRAVFHWPSLGADAAHGLTLVVYMGVASAAALQAGLLESLPPRTPVAVVQHASLPNERCMVCSLGELVERLQAEGIGSPTIIVVGDVLHGMHELQSLHEQRSAALAHAA